MPSSAPQPSLDSAPWASGRTLSLFPQKHLPTAAAGGEAGLLVASAGLGS